MSHKDKAYAQYKKIDLWIQLNEGPLMVWGYLIFFFVIMPLCFW
jgi:hypothetical protein